MSDTHHTKGYWSNWDWQAGTNPVCAKCGRAWPCPDAPNDPEEAKVGVDERATTASKVWRWLNEPRYSVLWVLIVLAVMAISQVVR